VGLHPAAGIADPSIGPSTTFIPEAISIFEWEKPQTITLASKIERGLHLALLINFLVSPAHNPPTAPHLPFLINTKVEPQTTGLLPIAYHTKSLRGTVDVHFLDWRASPASNHPASLFLAS
jgi:hypothetical protein